MTREDIFSATSETIKETFEAFDTEISDSTVAGDIPGWDSLSHTVLMLTLEQVFSIKLSSKVKYKNVGELVDYISSICGN